MIDWDALPSAAPDLPPDGPQLSTQRYRQLFDEAPVGIHVSRPDGTLLNCNAAFARMLGYESPTDLVGRSVIPLCGPDLHGAWLARVRRHGRVEQKQGTLRTRDGRSIRTLCSAAGVFDDSGELIELHGYAVDITRTADAQDRLEDRERRFHAVFVDAADPIIVLDDRRVICDANPAAGLLLCAAPDDLVGQSFDAYVLDGDAGALEGGWRELLAFGEARREYRVRVRHHSERLVECSFRASVREGRHLCIARDVTERRRLEERLVQSERIESVGRLAGGIAHDFNNLLTAILGYTELLLNGRGPDDPERQELEQIQKAGQRAAALTQRLLAYSRKQVLVPKDVDLNVAIVNLRSMLARLIRADIALTAVPCEELATIRIDPTQLEQAVTNLVLNARDALPGGGHIRLEVARVQLSQADVPIEQSTPVADYVRLRVCDDGIGIAPEARAHLFEPFFTTKEFGQGTGLGLASVYGIVRQSQGFINVDSETGRGTTFTMHFPAVAVERPQTKALSARSTASPRETILLVEDEDSVRVIVGAVLRRHGYHVFEAATPQIACELFAAHQDHIHLLVTDVVMPDMNGPALAQRLVAMRPSLRVLFISGYADGGAPGAGSAPNVSFLSKPFPASVLIERVQEILAAASSTALPS